MKRIQIALVSKETLPVFYMINEFLPDTVYLLGTEQTRGEMADIERVARLHGVQHVARRTVPADDMAACLQACEQIHAENGNDCQYCYNLTCGTKLMAFGALLCAQSHHAKMVYTDTTRYVDFDTMEHKPVTRFLDTETIIALQGQRIKEKTVYAYNKARLACACDIRNFIRQHRKTYGVLASHYRKYQQMPRVYDNYSVHYERNEYDEISIMEGNVEVLWSDYKHVFDMLFKGQWWETLVADAVQRWAGTEHEVWTNVVFNPVQKLDSENAKNEIDVLVNINNVLLFIECKSGMFDQNNIYKLKSVRETYGSYKSKGVIVAFSRDNIKDGFEEKAKENNIHILVPNSDLSNLPALLDKIVKSQNA